jgi:uncharacterized protein DUF4440
MSLNAEQLLAIVQSYWPADMEAYLKPGTSIVYARLQELWARELEKMDQWRAFLGELARVLPDFTIGNASSERLEAMERYFQGGEAKLELVQSYASGDMVVLVVIERQHGKVGGLPDQDWSLRVTLVYRRDGAEWRLVHRHADPLVHGMSLEHAAALARG